MLLRCGLYSANIVLIVTYLFLSLNQLFVTKSEAFQSVHHVKFILCYNVLYNFLGLRFATVGAKRTSTGCPAPLYLPLSEFVNTGGTI